MKRKMSLTNDHKPSSSVFFGVLKSLHYEIAPIEEQDVYFNDAMVKKIKESMQEAKDGQCITISTSEEIKELLGL